MPPQTKKPVTKGSKPSATKKKGGNDYEESKEASHIIEGDDDQGEELEDSQMINEEDELVNKYGFKQQVELELTLPTDEKEYITDYEMKFLDRNYQVKQFSDEHSN